MLSLYRSGGNLIFIPKPNTAKMAKSCSCCARSPHLRTFHEWASARAMPKVHRLVHNAIFPASPEWAMKRRQKR
jgi:hypothetical protein